MIGIMVTQRSTHIFKTLMYVGESNKYGMKLVNRCHGSIAKKPEMKYTDESEVSLVPLR